MLAGWNGRLGMFATFAAGAKGLVAPYRRVDPSAGAAVGAGKWRMGVSQDSWRAGDAGGEGRGLDGVGDPQGRRHRARADGNGRARMSLISTSRLHGMASLSAASGAFARTRNHTMLVLAAISSTVTPVNCGNSSSISCEPHTGHSGRQHPNPRARHADQPDHVISDRALKRADSNRRAWRSVRAVR